MESLKPKMTVKVDDFMSKQEEEEENGAKAEEKAKEKDDFDIKKILSDFILKKELFITEREGDITQFYDIVPKPIGEGAFGEVFKGIEKHSTDEVRAIKKINKHKIKNPQRFFNEVTALKTLDHPNVIKLYEIFEDSENVFL